MAQRYYSIEKAAEVLGIPPAEVNRLREKNELHAYRDGADWKFKAEEVDEYRARHPKSTEDSTEQSAEVLPEDSGDVLFSEVELGGADSGTSGTVIGSGMAGSRDSDVQLTDSEVRLAASGLHLSEELIQPGGQEPATPSDIAKADDLELTLDADLTLEDSHVPLISEPVGVGFGTGDSSLELADAADLEDDDLVLGGSSSGGSDITIGGDSGISLVDPTDSGLSLEEPLSAVEGEESLELGEDDMLAISEGSGVTDSESPTQLKADSDFLLTPMEEVAGEDTESSSQVIALDADSEVDDSAATMVTSMSEIGVPAAPGVSSPSMSASMSAMLEEEPTAGPPVDLEVAQAAAAPMAQPVYAAAAVGAAVPTMPAMPEQQYGTLWVTALGSCTLFLAIGGMMAFDLLRNMWSWNSPYSFNSSLMDLFLK